jgi:hypothetical protein
MSNFEARAGDRRSPGMDGICAAILGKLVNPFRARRSPHLAVGATDAREWAASRDLIRSVAARQRFETALYADFAARVYPEAPVRPLCVATRWCAWLFLFDDHFDDSLLGRDEGQGWRILERLLQQVATLGEGAAALPSASPIEAALVELWSETGPAMSEGWRRRFARHLGDYLRSYTWEIGNRAEQVAPDLTQYIEMRRDTGATWIGLDLIEYVAGAEVPPKIYDSLPLRTLNLAAIDAICWTNDIASYAKERARGEVNNIVYIAQQAFGLDLQAAMDFTRRMQDSRVELFCRTAETLSEELDAGGATEDERMATHAYVRGLQDWIRGNLDWSLATARYLEVEHRPKGDRVSWTENISQVAEDLLVAPSPQAKVER